MTDQLSKPETEGQREVIIDVAASLAAAISLLERVPTAKKGAPSDKMFDVMLSDYRKTLERARVALASVPPQDGTAEALRLLRKISDLVDAEDVGEPLDDAISYANKAIAALTSGASAPQDRAYAAALANLKEAWSALAMIRETVEMLAPSGSVKAAEHLDGPTFMHEAEALIAGIQALAAPNHSQEEGKQK